MGELEPVSQTFVAPVGVTSSTRMGQIKNRFALRAMCLFIFALLEL